VIHMFVCLFQGCSHHWTSFGEYKSSQVDCDSRCCCSDSGEGEVPETTPHRPRPQVTWTSQMAHQYTRHPGRARRHRKCLSVCPHLVSPHGASAWCLAHLRLFVLHCSYAFGCM